MRVIFTCPECGHESIEMDLDPHIIAHGLIQCGRGGVGCLRVARIKRLFYDSCFRLIKSET